MSPGTSHPDIPTDRIARVYAALTGNKWSDISEREVVAPDDYRGARERVRQVRQFHAAAALKAVTRGARGLVFAACGYPASPADPADPTHPNPHAAAAAACRDARFCYISASGLVAAACEAELATAGCISAGTADLRDPEELMGCPEVKDLPRPLHLQAQMQMHFWPPGLARGLIADYARLLGKGDELALTWILPSDTPGGRELAARTARVTGAEVYPHTAKDVAGWLADAGLRVAAPGPVDVRGLGPVWAERARAAKPGRAMGVVARKR